MVASVNTEPESPIFQNFHKNNRGRAGPEFFPDILKDRFPTIRIYGVKSMNRVPRRCASVSKETAARPGARVERAVAVRFIG
jgi:hypothetical protein